MKLERTGLDSHIDNPEEQAPGIVRFWILRILLRLGASRRLFDPDEISSGDVAMALGISIGHDHQATRGPSLIRSLRSLLSGFPAAAAEIPLPTQLASNVSRVGNLLGLTDVERNLMALAVLARTERGLTAAMEMLGFLPTARAYQAVAVLIDATDKEIREALSPRGTLCRTGLLSVDRESNTYLQNKMDVLSDGFAERMTLLDSDPAELLRDKVFPSRPPTLGIADFQHIQMLADLARSHLARALHRQLPGTNILIHGVPGVGKTEFARVLAADLGVELYEISSEDEDGDPIDGDRRLRAFRAGQWFFSRRKLLFLFDEVEDVFSGDDGFFRARSHAHRRKAWMNRTLELNPIPTIWITNQVRSLDPAFIRRFDIVIELLNPPPSQRAKIVRMATDGLGLDDSVVDQLASDQNLTPAVVVRAAQVATSLAADGSHGPGDAMVLLVSSTLRAQGYAGVARVAGSTLPDIYDTQFINADVDLADLSARLNPSSSARVLLHGPPGTGKTAYAQWLCKQIGRPALIRRASDLLSMYVGEAEKALAAAFAEATNEGSVLLLDEVDSFLQDRKASTTTWEVSAVNEMLTQMESFQGLMLATTNLLSSLDSAALRRFDMKIGLSYLRPDQSLAIFRRTCGAVGADSPCPSIERKVGALTTVTPGDFGVVLRLSALRRGMTPADIFDLLSKECAHKASNRRRIGFV